MSNQIPEEQKIQVEEIAESVENSKENEITDEDEQSPETGDKSMLALSVALCVTSACCLTATYLIISKKRRLLNGKNKF